MSPAPGGSAAETRSATSRTPGSPRAKSRDPSNAQAPPESGRSAGAHSPIALMTAMFFMLLVQLSTECAEVQGSSAPAADPARPSCQPPPEDVPSPHARPPEKVFTVSQLTERVKATLEDGFPWVTVEGEISNFRPSSTGHYYFSLKDSEAMLSVVMFRNRLAGLRFVPADGQLVRASGSVSVYAKRGSYQLVCESLARERRG